MRREEEGRQETRRRHSCLCKQHQPQVPEYRVPCASSANPPPSFQLHDLSLQLCILNTLNLEQSRPHPRRAVNPPDPLQISTFQSPPPRCLADRRPTVGVKSTHTHLSRWTAISNDVTRFGSSSPSDPYPLISLARIPCMPHCIRSWLQRIEKRSQFYGQFPVRLA